MKELAVADIKPVERPSFKSEIPLTTFRLLRLFGFREVFGESAGPVLYMAGKSLGKQLEVGTVDGFLDQLQVLKIGYPEMHDFDGERGIVRVHECMTCYGLPDIGKLICDFENGVIAGGLEKVTGRRVNAVQKKGWTNGDKYCEFHVVLF
ncbi:hypothetical protein SY88_08405 [Clostridiales bacterium PH28_bin88]|nr:hypothetical protein SY88_08405 [Clostridiales bacterium PH28_bin88]